MPLFFESSSAFPTVLPNEDYATNLQHYRPYHPLWGSPLLCYLERDTIPPKKIRQTIRHFLNV